MTPGIPPTVYPPQEWFDQLLARYETYHVPMLPSDISLLLGKEMTEHWNKMPERWRWRINPWPKDPEFIERIVRTRIADYAHHQSVAKARFSAARTASFARNDRIMSSRFRGATFTLTLAAAAAAARYMSRKLELPALGSPESGIIDPTIIIDDRMETGKGFTTVKSKHPATMRLIPGAGIAYSNALVIQFTPINEPVWREAHIIYTMPTPIRKYFQVSFMCRSIAFEGPAYLSAWTEWDWAGFRYWSGLMLEPQNTLYPFSLLSFPNHKRLTTTALGRSITMGYAPSSWAVDTETLEYDNVCIFGQLFNVKGVKVSERERTKGIGKAELHFQVWHPWKTPCRVDLDSVLLVEYGPYRDDLRAEEKRRSKVMPLETLPA